LHLEVNENKPRKKPFFLYNILGWLMMCFQFLCLLDRQLRCTKKKLIPLAILPDILFAGTTAKQRERGTYRHIFSNRFITAFWAYYFNVLFWWTSCSLPVHSPASHASQPKFYCLLHVELSWLTTRAVVCIA
jgi:hypothetical protein